ncbi:hypothetical protein [Undibacterium sp. TS12]|uniref:hypothetical protein n=1 Tax=Undibacterium sp. TS12 TaxID=2908202 RepID=UPI001F4CB2FC|nr:hypothetical protein [Undibacterium sp. TS12]MCH8622549.1 hypothetical protein [Undibacterium sp. TS12]
MELPDFDRFEIEDCELISLGLENEGRDVVMKWTCPVRGWRWKRRVFKGLRAVFFPQSEFLAYAVELRFLAVSGLGGSYVDTVHKTVSPALFVHGSPILSELRCVQLASGGARLHVELDEGTIGFEFADCIQREISMDEHV